MRQQRSLFSCPVNFSGTPEIGGWTTRELIQILKGLAGVNVVGGDVVEVAPVYDTQAELTGLAAAGVVEILVELMVKKSVASLEEGPRRGDRGRDPDPRRRGTP